MRAAPIVLGISATPERLASFLESSGRTARVARYAGERQTDATAPFPEAVRSEEHHACVPIWRQARHLRPNTPPACQRLERSVGNSCRGEASECRRCSKNDEAPVSAPRGPRCGPHDSGLRRLRPIYAGCRDLRRRRPRLLGVRGGVLQHNGRLNPGFGAAAGAATTLARLRARSSRGPLLHRWPDREGPAPWSERRGLQILRPNRCCDRRWPVRVDHRRLPRPAPGSSTLTILERRC